MLISMKWQGRICCIHNAIKNRAARNAQLQLANVTWTQLTTAQGFGAAHHCPLTTRRCGIAASQRPSQLSGPAQVQPIVHCVCVCVLRRTHVSRVCVFRINELSPVNSLISSLFFCFCSSELSNALPAYCIVHQRGPRCAIYGKLYIVKWTSNSCA